MSHQLSSENQGQGQTQHHLKREVQRQQQTQQQTQQQSHNQSQQKFQQRSQQLSQQSSQQQRQYKSSRNKNERSHDVSLADFRVGVDNVIFSVDTDLQRLLVLLVMRHDEPFLGKWCLPGTLVRTGEALEAAADRILAEKIRVQNLYLEQLYTFGGPMRDPREAEESYGVRYLSVSYFALVRYSEAELIADGVSGIAWYPMDQLPELAFDHAKIIQYGHCRLRNKLEYSPVAFEVLPDLFTLSDLYQLYTTVLGETFSDYSNFRSRLLKLKFLQDTGIKTSRGAGRPASLYKFDADAFEPLKDKALVFI